jgi:hypothetical protein
LDPNAVGTTVVDSTTATAVTVPARVPGFSTLEVYAKASGEEGTSPDTPSFDPTDPTAFAGTTIVSGATTEVTGSFGTFSMVRHPSGQITVTYQLFTATQNQTVYDQFTALGETGRLYEKLTVYASDGTAGSRPFEYEVTINGVNDAPTGYTITGTVVSDNPEVGVLSAIDPDTSDTTGFTFAIAGGADAGSFSITANALGVFNVLTFTGTRKDPGDPYELMITVTDSSGATSDPLALNLTEAAFYLDMDPTNAGGRRFSSHQDDENNDGVLEGLLVENAEANVVLGTLKSVLSPNEVLQLIDNTTADNASFTTDAAGVLTFNGSPSNPSGNFEDGKTWTIVVGVGTGLTNQETYVIRLSNENDNSPDAVTVEGTQVALSEGDITDGTLTGYSVSSNDPDGGDVTWAIYDAETGGTAVTNFRIDDQGRLVFVGDRNVDYETTQSTVLWIEAVDSGVGATPTAGVPANSARSQVTISYTDVNEHAPTAVTISSAVLTPGATAVGTLGATDADGNPSFTFSFTNGSGNGTHNDRFEINGNALSFNPDATRLSPGSLYMLTITVSDGVNTYEQDLTVTEGGVFIEASQNGPEADRRYSGYNDNDNGLLAEEVTVRTSLGYLGSASAATGETVVLTDNTSENNALFEVVSGELFFRVNSAGAHDYEADPRETYTIQTHVLETDGSTVKAGSVETYVIHVSNVNDNAPVITDYTTAARTTAILEGSFAADNPVVGVASFAATDDDGGEVTTWKITSDSAGANADNRFKIVNGELQFASAFSRAFADGDITIYVFAADSGTGGTPTAAGGAFSAGQRVDISIEDRNEAPSITTPATLEYNAVNANAINTDVTGAVFAATDPDTGHTAALVWSLETITGTNGDFKIDSSTGQIQLAVAGSDLDATGSVYTLRVRATDPGIPAAAGLPAQDPISDFVDVMITVIDNVPARAINAAVTNAITTDVDENSTTAVRIATVTVTDGDGSPHGLMVNTTTPGVRGDMFEFRNSTLTSTTNVYTVDLYLKDPIDHEAIGGTTGEVSLTVSIGTSSTLVTSAINFTVADVQENTVFPTTLPSFTLDDTDDGTGTAPSTGAVTVGTFAATDPEGDTTTYETALVSATAYSGSTALTINNLKDAFAVNATTGAITYTGAKISTLHASVITRIDVVITAKSTGVGGSSVDVNSPTISITVNNVDEGDATFTISGSTELGGTLTVALGTADPDGSTPTNVLDLDTTSIQWYRVVDGGANVEITGATGKSFTLTQDQVGHKVTAEVTYRENSVDATTGNAKTSETVEAAATATVTGPLVLPSFASLNKVDGTVGGDTALAGTTGDDFIRGGSAADTITGGGGNDVFAGGYGDDNVTLNDGGNDVVLYRWDSRFTEGQTTSTQATDGGDQTHNFRRGEDTLVLIDTDDNPVSNLSEWVALSYGTVVTPLVSIHLDGTTISRVDISFNLSGYAAAAGSGPRAGSVFSVTFDTDGPRQAYNDVRQHFNGFDLSNEAFLPELFGGGLYIVDDSHDAVSGLAIL